MPILFGTTIWEAVRLARAKDENAARELVGKYRPPLLMFIRRLGVPEADAEDCCQEVFIRLFTGNILDNAAPQRGKFRTLLIGVAKNVVREWLRRKGAREVSLDEMDLTHLAASHDSFARAWFTHLLAVALDRLKSEHPDNAAVVALDKYLRDGLEYKQIAEQLGVTVGAVSGLVHRGRMKLFDALKREIAEYALTEDDFEGELRQATDLLRGG